MVIQLHLYNTISFQFRVGSGRGVMVSGWHAEQRELDLQEGAKIPASDVRTWNVHK